ncbi:hypothetical protein CPB83DRAFT_855468 [Crepidotus variabilis]|uniref:UDP-Glycosyltransferase/glycogen phosphorylase n=1 Tax=Crepidotus variabilis TaxID=179855 RepID=A0A9P6EFH2_9AGAR|nr:hypothetical protein CPB83DRAFT_855468 [Crepidotus variabilis]
MVKDLIKTQDTAHFLFGIVCLWGHMRPMLAMAFNLLEMYPQLYITSLIPQPFLDYAHSDIASFGPKEDTLHRFRLVPLGTKGVNPKDFVTQVNSFIEELPLYLANLSIQTQATQDGDVSEGFAQPPTLAIADLLYAAWTRVIKEVANDATNAFSHIPTLAFSPTPAAWCLRRATAKGGSRFKALVADPSNAGRPEEELLEQAYTFTNGELVHVVGTEPMYDYELQPQLGSIPFNPQFTRIVQEASGQLKECLGLILCTSSDLEPGVKQELEKQIGGICLQVGPQFPERLWMGKEDQGTNAGALTEEDEEVMSFLDVAEKRFGSKSVLYISFGSTYSPSKRPDLLEVLVQSLLTVEPPLPFVFATATTGYLISDALRHRVKNSGGRGMFAKFAPQQRLLQHSATGWFLTHGGSNSVSESILNKIPMILWPCMTDQPIAASILTLNFQVAFELIQVRTGPSVSRPTYRGPTPLGTHEAILEEMADVWARLRGSEGRQMRDRMELLHEKLKLSWSSGEANADMIKLSQWF